MNNELVKDLANGFLFIMLDILFFQHLSIFGASLDPILFYVIWLVQKYSRTQLLIFTALLAFLQDAIFDLWGLMIFSKTLTFFVVYNFIKKRAESQLLMWQIFILIVIVAILHNLILFSYGNFFNTYSIDYSPFVLIFGNSIYTALVGVLIYIFRIKS